MLQLICSFPDQKKKVVFGPIVYNRAIVHKRQNFLKVVVHVIIIDQCNQATSEVQVTVSYSRAILVGVTSECC